MKMKPRKAEKDTQVQTAFRIFDLLGELRNAIYDFVPCRSRVIQEPDDRCPYRVWSRSSSKTYLLMVSKQFSHEYNDKALKRSTLRIQDTYGPTESRLRLPTAALHPSRITCDLTCATGQQKQDLDYHAEMIAGVMQQLKSEPSLQRTIYFEFSRSARPNSAKELREAHKTALDRLTNMASLEVLRLCVSKYHMDEGNKLDRKLVTRYTKDYAWVECDVSELAT